MLTLNNIFNELLLEGRLEQAQKKYPKFHTEIEQLADVDPSGKLKYLAWQVKQLALDEPITEIISLVNQFHNASKRLSKKDIYQYKTLGDLRHAFETELKVNDGPNVKQIKKEEAEKLYEDEQYVLILPKTKEASCLYGKGTKWCIAATQSENYFDQYVLDAETNALFFFLINKQMDTSDPNHKLAFTYIRNEDLYLEELQVFDAHDTQIGQTKGLESIEDEDKRTEIKRIMDSYLTRRYATPTKKKFMLIYGENTSPEVLAKLASDKNKEIRAGIANNSSTPPEVLIRLYKDPDPEVRLGVAANKNLPTEMLKTLSGDKDSSVRFNVAINKGAPPEILKVLSTDEEFEVRRAAIGNPNASIEMLTSAANDNNNKYIRAAIARNHNTPLEVLKKLAHDTPMFISRYMVKNPNLTPELMQLLLKLDHTAALRVEIAKHHNASPEILDTLGGNISQYVRIAVVRNPNTSIETLKVLMKDRQWSIEREARARLEKEIALEESVFNKLLENVASTGYHAQGFAPSFRGGWSQIKQQPHKHPREAGFPYRNYEDTEDVEQEVEDFDTVVGIKNKLNIAKVPQSMMADPGSNYDTGRKTQMMMTSRGGSNELDFEDDQEYVSRVNLKEESEEMGDTNPKELAKFIVRSNKIEGYDVPFEHALEAVEGYLEGYPVRYVTNNKHISAHLAALKVAQELKNIKSVNSIREIHRAMGQDVLDAGSPGMIRTDTEVTSMGGTQYAPSSDVPAALSWWVSHSFNSPFEAHVAYELIHPFDDGNGRSGRVILAAMMNFDWAHINQFIDRTYFGRLNNVGKKFSGSFWNQKQNSEKLDEWGKSQYSLYKNQPGHHGSALHQQPSKAGGSLGMRGASVAHPGQGPAGWSAGMGEKASDDVWDESEEEEGYISPIHKFVRKSIRGTLKELVIAPIHGKDGTGSTGRFNGYRGLNTWARGDLKYRGLKKKDTHDDQDRLKLTQWYSDDERENPETDGVYWYEQKELP